MKELVAGYLLPYKTEHGGGLRKVFEKREEDEGLSKALQIPMLHCIIPFKQVHESTPSPRFFLDCLWGTTNW